MKFFRSLLGYTIAGLIVMSVWGEFGGYGIFGGYLAAIIIIGPMWYMNHYLNLTGNQDSNAFVDMGLAIGVAGIMRDTLMNGTEALVDSMPTIGLVVLGAVLGGIAAAIVEKSMSKETEREVKAPEPGMTEKELSRLINEE